MENKPQVAKEIVQSLEQRFRPEKAEGDYKTVIHLDIEGKNGGQFTAKVENGTCRVLEGFQGEPKCTVKTSDKVYEEIEHGKRSPEMAVMMGKIKISNINEMLTFAKLFRRLF